MLLGLLFFLIVLLLLPYTLEIVYQRCNGKDELKIIFWLWKIPLQLRMTYINWLGNFWVSLIEIGSDKNTLDLKYGVNISDLIERITKPIPKYLKLILMRATFLFQDIKILNIRLKYSTGNAALTGMVAGLLWATITNLIGFINTVCTFREKPLTQITPVYGIPMFDLDLHCIFKIHLGHIISKLIQRKMGKRGDNFGRRASN